MSGSTSSDDDAVIESDRFQIFLDDSDEEGAEQEEIDDSSSEDNDYRSSVGGNFDWDHEEDEEIIDEDEVMLDDTDDHTYRSSSYSIPMPWPPAVVSQQSERSELGGKKKKPGIIYLSSIPPGFNVARTISFFSQFGKVGRVFLQPDLKEKSKRKDKLARNFTEGWVEFLNKRSAKEVAASLNTTQVGGNKRSKAHDVIWNIKYLPRFKWTHLSERLAYERASHSQKMRAEVSQAKREADFFRANVEKSKKILKKGKLSSEALATNMEVRQKEPDDVVRQKRIKMSDEEPLGRKIRSKKKTGGKQTKGVSPTLPSRKTKKSSAEGTFSPAKRARTRSSDRKEFLQNVFGGQS